MEFLALFAIITVSLCGADEINFKEFTSGNREFTANVYKNLTTTNGNFLLSPFSLETVLAVAQSGARNETGAEIRSALHLPKDVKKVEAMFKHLTPKLKGRKSYSLLTSNKIYLQTNYSIHQRFQELARTVYNCPIDSVDFSRKEQAANTINSWVEKRTNGKIHHILEANTLDDSTKAVLVNSVYFRGEWQKAFKHYSTKRESFFTSVDEEAVEVEMMHGHDVYHYFESDKLGAKFLKMTFKGCRKVQMVFVLPNKKDGLGELEEHVDRALITPIFEKKHVHVALPKFKIETQVDFKEILQSMGIVKAFGEGADFSGIAGEKGDLHISEVVQKTFIDVGEDGVEATAATSVQFSSRSFLPYIGEKKSFVADHPFLFYIKIKNVIVFAGRVVSPST